MRNTVLIFLTCMAGCAPSPEAALADLQLTPSEGSMYGYYSVEAQVDAPVDEVWLGQVRAFDITWTDGVLAFRIHGHPTPGPVDLTLVSQDTETVYPDAFRFLPAEPGFERVVAIGASLTQGVQGGVPTQHGQLNTPSAFVAQQAGAYHPPPLFVDGLFPAIRGSDIGPPPECDSPNVVDYLTDAAIDVLLKLNDEENNTFGFHLGLVDPDLQPYNLAVGGSDMSTLLYGPDPAAFEQLFLGRFVFDPYGGLSDPIDTSPVAMAESLGATVILCADTYGNNLLSWDDLDEVEPDMVALIERLSQSGAQVFLSNIPRLTLLPGAGANADRDALADAYREAFEREAGKYDNIHVVDLYAAVEAEVEDGLDIAGTNLSMEAYDGLLSSDLLHLSDVGYAWQANLFIDKVNEVMGTDLAPIDLDVVYATDEHSPHALLEQGIDPACVDL